MSGPAILTVYADGQIEVDPALTAGVALKIARAIEELALGARVVTPGGSPAEAPGAPAAANEIHVGEG